MKKYIFYSILLVAALVANFGCNAYTDIQATADKDANFSKFKSFAWLPDKADTANTPYNNEIIRNNIRNYFSKEMSDRGLKVDTENPDLLLEIAITNTPHRVWQTYNDRYYYSNRYYYRSRYYSPYRNRYYYERYPQYMYDNPMGYQRRVPETHIDNSITFNVVDAKMKRLAWTGTIGADIYDPSVIQHDIHPAIIKLMERFPIKITDKAVAYSK